MAKYIAPSLLTLADGVFPILSLLENGYSYHTSKVLSMPLPLPLPEIGEGSKKRKRECGSFAPALPFSRYFWEQQCATAISTPPASPPTRKLRAPVCPKRSMAACGRLTVKHWQNSCPFVQ